MRKRSPIYLPHSFSSLSLFAVPAATLSVPTGGFDALARACENDLPFMCLISLPHCFSLPYLQLLKTYQEEALMRSRLTGYGRLLSESLKGWRKDLEKMSVAQVRSCP
jgi:hypothetical protein